MRTQAVLLGSLTIPGHPACLHAAREFIARTLGPDHGRLDTTVLLTSELVTNSLKHSQSARSCGTVSITLISVPAGIRVEVIDDGSENEPTVRHRELESPELAESGRGLKLVEFLSANWGYYRDTAGTVTWFELTEEPDE
jgi:anti-sigma regulatory factor (Ser/Thr protein kinase)